MYRLTISKLHIKVTDDNDINWIVDKLMSLSSVPFMCSFDSFSLYTNIPFDETINICIDKLFKDNNTVQNLSRGQFGKLLNYCVKQNHFVHNGILYDQIDGVAMGSPLGPILANVFISNLECQALKKYSGNLPLVYNRYVDEPFLIVSDRDDSELFLEYMNNII